MKKLGGVAVAELREPDAGRGDCGQAGDDPEGDFALVEREPGDGEDGQVEEDRGRDGEDQAGEDEDEEEEADGDEVGLGEDGGGDGAVFAIATNRILEITFPTWLLGLWWHSGGVSATFAQSSGSRGSLVGFLTNTNQKLAKTGCASRCDINNRNMMRSSMFALLFFATTVFAESPFVGIWKQDLARTKFESGDPGTNTTLVIQERGDNLSVRVKSTTTDGGTFSLTYTLPLKGGVGKVLESSGRLDGVRSTVINEHVRENVFTRAGKESAVRRWVVSDDRKTMEVVESGVDKDGKPFKGKGLFRKQ